MKKNNSILKGVLKTIIITLSIGIITAILLVFIIPTFLSIFLGKDLATVDDSHLQLGVVDLEVADNMYFGLKKLSTMETYEPKELELHKEFLNSDILEEEIILDLLEKNRSSLQMWTVTSGFGNYQNPSTSDGSKINMESSALPMGRIRVTSRISIIKALWLAKNGNEEQAFEEIFKSIKIGYAMMESQATTIEYLVGISLFNNGIEGMQKIISQAGDNEVIERYRNLLRELKIENFTAYLKWEYLFSKDAIQAITAGRYQFLDSKINRIAVNNKFYYKENKTLSYYALDYSKLIENANSACTDKEEVETRRNLEFRSLLDFPKIYFTDNVIGKLLYLNPSLALSNVETKKCELMQKKSISEVVLAIKSYELENKEKLEDIDNLVPDYLTEIITDPMTGEKISLDIINDLTNSDSNRE